jgi:DeoR family glycerol-3-phosphate regulon repressor/DeoR family fructose operon transcriptional repressor
LEALRPPAELRVERIAEMKTSKCELAPGTSADRRRNLLIGFASAGSIYDACSQPVRPEGPTPVAPGETLIVNGGSTAVAFAASLGDLTQLTIVTNNLGLPSAFPASAVANLYLLGGEIRSGAHITLGPVGFVGTRQITADTPVIGIGGITEDGCSTSRIEEASMIAAMIAAARRTIVIADSTKFGRTGFAVIAPLDKIDVLVTDAEPSGKLREALDAAGVRLVIA